MATEKERKHGREKNKRNRKKQRLVIQAIKNIYKCSDCRENRPGSLTFHHVDPKQKRFGIGSRGNVTFKQFFLEISKCIILCRRCHNKRHD